MSTNRKQQLKEFTDWAKEQLKSMGTYAQEMGSSSAQAMFEVIRAGAEPSEFQRETMTRFRDGIPAEKAWAEDDPIFFPPMLVPQVPLTYTENHAVSRSI